MKELILKNQVLLNNLKTLPMLVKNIFYSTNTSSLNLDINKTQEAILMAIKDYQNKSMNEISRFIGLEKSSYTRSVDILAEKGFVEREINKFDKRKVHLLLTEKGKNATKAIDEIMDIHLDSICNNFNIQEKEEFIKALGIVSQYSIRISNNKNGGNFNATSY